MKILQAVVLLLFVVVPCAGAYETPNKGDMYWLAQNIYHEARSESIFGMLMVGFVTLERLGDGRWGNSVKKVVTARKQFSWYSDGKSDIPTNKTSWKMSKDVAILSYIVYNMFNGTGILYYHNQSCNPYWSNVYNKVMTYGQHTFYKET